MKMSSFLYFSPTITRDKFQKPAFKPRFNKVIENIKQEMPTWNYPGLSSSLNPGCANFFPMTIIKLHNSGHQLLLEISN